MTVVTRRDLDPGYQLVQSAHAIANFVIYNPVEAKKWHEESNYIVSLSTENEQSLKNLISKLESKEITHVVFREPDIDNQITAVAIAPCDETRRLTSSFPLALKGIGNGVNKNCFINSTEHGAA